VAAAAGLNGGLLVGADDIGIRLQFLALEDPVVEVQDHPGLGSQVGVAGEDPGAVLPRLDRVLGQPAPQRGGGDVVDQAGGEDLGAQFGEAPPAKRYSAGGGQLAGDRLARGDHRGREGAGAAGPLAVAEPSRPSAKKRLRHLVTVLGASPSLRAIPRLVHPAAASSTILALVTWRYSAVPRRTNAFNHRRCDARRVIWNRLRPPPPATIPPVHRPARWPAGAGGYGTRPDGIGEDGPMPKTLPESTKTSLGQRLRARQRERWPALAGVQARFWGRFAYVDGELNGGEVLPLCRLRYAGSASLWGFAVYLASRDGYQDSVLPSGLPVGTPEEALDCACGLYLADPSAWQEHLPPASS
jgi:hypothetical protein